MPLITHEMPQNPIDFSVTTSPLGVADCIRQAVLNAAGHLEAVPDPTCSALCRQIGECEGVDPSYIYCGADTADLASRLLRVIHPKKALVPAPSYSLYEALLAEANCKISRCMLWEAKGFLIGGGFLEAITPELDCVFLCQPNNPTGLMAPQQVLLALIEKCARNGVYLILDECFLDFLENPMLATEKPLLSRYPNLIILKSPSVTHGMAGLKLAYCMTSNRQLLSGLYSDVLPCAVSSVAQAAGIAAMQDSDSLEQARRLFSRERGRMIEILRACGATVYPGEANYLLFRTSEPDLAVRLAEKGIKIEDCSAVRGLAPGYYRISLRTAAENARFAVALHALTVASRNVRASAEEPFSAKESETATR
jgi:threonine-phosphate decarboxylase